jgi:hypothetical protein
MADRNLVCRFQIAGLQPESCRVNMAQRIKMLIFVLSIAAVWAIKPVNGSLSRANKSRLRPAKTNLLRNEKPFPVGARPPAKHYP